LLLSQWQQLWATAFAMATLHVVLHISRIRCVDSAASDMASGMAYVICFLWRILALPVAPHVFWYFACISYTSIDMSPSIQDAMATAAVVVRIRQYEQWHCTGVATALELLLLSFASLTTS
jgi:hypothetical protein